jgi:methionyl-tRNA formyltransferase
VDGDKILAGKPCTNPVSVSSVVLFKVFTSCKVFRVTPPFNIVFMGTAPLAAASLQALHGDAGMRVLAVVTQPDKPAGRDLKLQFSAVKQAALAVDLPVLQPERARHPEFLQQVKDLAPDLIVVAAYGQILPQSLLDVPRFGCLNVHASLLPRYRGAAPIQWAILDGQPETGVTIMKMDAGLDTGPMLSTVATAIHADDTGGSLHDRLAELGARLLRETIPGYVAGQITPQPQPAEGASYARKITKEDGLIDWTTPARAIWNRVRGLNPWPSAFTHLPGGGSSASSTAPALLKIWRAEVCSERNGAPGTVLDSTTGELLVACGQESLRILELQREGRRRVTAAEFLSGYPLPPGTLLGA